MNKIIVGTIVVVLLGALAACTKTSSKGYFCERNVHLECELTKNASDCREAQAFLATEKDTGDPVRAGMAGDRCRLEMEQADRAARAAGYAKVEDFVTRKPAGQ